MTSSLAQHAEKKEPLTMRRLFIGVLWFFAGYWILSCLTLPFVGRFWWGEIPVLGIIQVPKLLVAGWLRVHVVMKGVTLLGFSSGSFSPDYILARPYALIIAYLIVFVLIGILGFVIRFS